jgi:ribosomal-protein-alanine N-acetyltransferase
MDPLYTARLIIRNFTPTDWQPLHTMIVQYRASEFGAYDQPWPTSPEEIQGVAQWFASGNSFLAVCLKDSGDFIGFVGLNPEEQPGVYNLGYVFNSDFHGKGYAYEACQAILKDAFSTRGAVHIISGTAAANTSSVNLLHKLGFTKTGESTGSLQNDAEGNPIMFLGYSYELTSPLKPS